MLKEIYFRDLSDPRYLPGVVETSNTLEALIYKIKMILLTDRGDILGDSDFGMDLESYLFDNKVPEQVIRERFHSQVARFIPETEYSIDLEFGHSTDNYKNFANIYVMINGQKMFGLSV